MEKIRAKAVENINIIKEKTGSNPGIIVKCLNIFDTDIYFVMDEALTDNTYIDNYVLKFFATLKINEKNIKPNKYRSIFDYFKDNITAQKITTVDNIDDMFFNLFCGFTIIFIDECETALAIETRAQLDSGIQEAKNEMVIKGPKDGFTENFQSNIGLVRKRIRSENLWLKEVTVGKKSKTKVGIMYLNGVASKELVDQIVKKIESIKIDGIFDSNFIVEAISENKKNVFSNYLSTERPDQVSMYILEGRIAIFVENTQYVVVIPTLFVDFFHSAEDYYQKTINVNYTRIIRFLSLVISLFGPAIYIALVTYNIEVIPDKLLLSIAVQRQGVPLPTIVETLVMLLMFEITRETDAKLPNAIGSALSIVGAVVLGQAAVMAGLVSPTSIIIAGATTITGMIAYSMDMVGGIRWWRTMFLFFAAVLGIFGVFLSGVIFITNITSIKSFGIPFFAPIAPFYKSEQNNAIFITNKRKFERKNPFMSIFKSKGQEDKK
jgi:spore germination protein KA